MRRLNLFRLWALILALFVLIGPGAILLQPGTAYSFESDMFYVPEGGGDGGGYGDPDDPQNKPTSVVPGGTPVYGVTGSGSTSGVSGTVTVPGRNSVWMLRLRILIAGLRYYYLRF